MHYIVYSFTVWSNHKGLRGSLVNSAFDHLLTRRENCLFFKTEELYWQNILSVMFSQIWTLARLSFTPLLASASSTLTLSLFWPAYKSCFSCILFWYIVSTEINSIVKNTACVTCVVGILKRKGQAAHFQGLWAKDWVNEGDPKDKSAVCCDRTVLSQICFDKSPAGCVLRVVILWLKDRCCGWIK